MRQALFRLPVAGRYIAVGGVVAVAATILLLAAYAGTLGIGIGALSGITLMAGLLRSGSRPDTDYNESREAQTGWQAVEAEAARSRRTGDSFAIVAFPTGRDLIKSLRPLLRTSDRAWLEGSVVHVLLTDCDSAQASRFLARVQSALPEAADFGRVSVALFPEAAITVGGLVTHLRANSEQPVVQLHPMTVSSQR